MAMPRKKPKSFKSDGTPKKRWSAAERAARGHKPRRSGGVHNPKARLQKRRVVVFLFLKCSYGSKATSRLLQTVRIINTIFN